MTDSITENTGTLNIIKTVIKLSIPAIMAEVTSIVMQYIDSAMVGSLGANASAAIGLVSTSTWLVGGLCIAAATGFSVQIAHLTGADRRDDARNVFRQGLIVDLCFGILLAFIAMGISKPLPVWLGGDKEIHANASGYFFIFGASIPFAALRQFSGSCLQCSGDMKTPGILNTLLCLFDVIFNMLMIFQHIKIGKIVIPCAGLGVRGAALGTALSEITVSVTMFLFAALKSPVLGFKYGGSWRIKKQTMKTALRIAIPSAIEHAVTSGAYLASTVIVAPLGTISVAANSLAITAESFCYMPGYGTGSAATTLVGQAIGAEKRDLAKKYAAVTVTIGVLMMTVTGIIMFIIAPYMFAVLTPSQEVRKLGTSVLRIEAFAEPFYAASIVAAGVLRGAGDTISPGIMNLISMWGVRITAQIILVPHFGLYGVWGAMCGELCFRGIIFLIRLLRGKWLNMKIKI